MLRTTLVTAVFAASIWAGRAAGQEAKKPVFDKTPGWKSVEAGPFETFRLIIESPATAVVTVTGLPGDAGGLAANVTRWRNQLGLPVLGDKETLAALKPVTVAGVDGHLFDATGPEKNGSARRMLAAIVRVEGTTWFFRMAGPAEVVDAQKDAFQRFLKSVRFEPGRADAGAMFDGKSFSAWRRELGREDARAASRALAALSHEFHGAIGDLCDLMTTTEKGDLASGFSLVPAFGRAAVPQLTQLLWHDEPGVRFRGIVCLQRLGWEAREAAPAVMANLSHADPTLRGFAADLLGQLDAYSARPQLEKCLEDREPGVRFTAARVLATMDVPADRLLPVLLKAFDDKEANDARHALAVLALLGPEAAPARDVLVSSLGKLPREEQRAAIRTLRGMGPAGRESAAALKEFVKKNPYARPWVAEALWTFSPDAGSVADAAEMLRAYLKTDLRLDDHADPEDFAQAASLAARMGYPDEAAAALVRLIDHSPPPAVRRLGQLGAAGKVGLAELSKRLGGQSLESEIALARLGPAAAEALPALDKAVEKFADNVESIDRLFADYAAARIQPDAGARRLEPYLAAKNPAVRRVAIRGLGELGQAARPVLPAVKKLLKDPSDNVRTEAALAAWRIDRDRDAVPTLTTLLASPDSQAREEAAIHLGRIGAASSAATPALLRLMWDPVLDNRRTVIEEVSRIGPGAADAVPALAAVLASERPVGELSAACEALGEIGPKAAPALAALKRHLEHPCRLVRVHAAVALAKVADDDSGRKELLAGLGDRNYRVRIVAAEGLWRMSKDRRALDVLLHSLRTSNPGDDDNANNELFMAIRALGRIGPTAKEAAPLIAPRRQHYDLDLAAAAALALRSIQP